MDGEIHCLRDSKKKKDKIIFQGAHKGGLNLCKVLLHRQQLLLQGRDQDICT